MNGKDLKDRLLNITGLSLADIAGKLGMSPQHLNQTLNAADIKTGFLEKVCKTFGTDMSTLFGIEQTKVFIKDVDANVDAPDPTGKDYRLVPLINIDSVGGLHSWPEVTDETQYREKYIPFSGARDDDYCIRESGSSMVPSIPPGSILLIRNVPNWAEYFGYGAVYVLELTDGRRITKEIRKSEVDAHLNVLCHSFNDTVADEELPKSLIRSVWKVIKVLTTYGF